VRSSLLPVLLLSACGPGLRGLGTDAPALAEVRGHVDRASLGSPAGAPLLAGILWLGVQQPDFFCLAHASDPRLAPGCADPYWILPDDVAESAPVDAAGDFAIAMMRLPGSSALVGDADARIAYASVVVVQDDGDGVLEPYAPPTRDRLDHPPPDVVLAATFTTLRTPNERLALRLGGYDAGSTFYPAPGCSPPQGLSILDAPDVLGAGVCTSRTLEGPVAPMPVPEPERRAFSCPARGTYVDMASLDAPGPSYDVQVCVDPNTLALRTSTDRCPSLVVLRLVGCYDGREGDACTARPDFDLRGNPPEWWPC
jgi:hypothetical protein